MAQVDIPDFSTSRRRTRTYDTPSENTQAVIDAIAALLVPAGTFIPTALSEEPEGGAWKLCNGQALSKADYPRLYAAFGSRFGETDTTFNLPDMSGRAVMGVGPSLTLGGLAGQAKVTLSIAQMPRHGHAVTDPGHTHVFTGTPHSHTVTDPGHSHTVTDPGHAHSVDEAGGTADAATGTDEVTAQGGGTSGNATTGVSIDTAMTGVSVDDATAGGSNASSQTGISIGETGNGQPVDITPPVIGVNWLVRT